MSKNKALRASFDDDNDIKRHIMEHCTTRSRLTINPIIDWPNSMPLHFLRETNTPYCSLYNDGWERLGCLGCPMASYRNRIRGFKRWPHMERYYRRAFADMLAHNPDYSERYGWHDADDVWHWWLEDGFIKGQTEFELEEGVLG